MALLPLRLFLAITFIYAGIQKLSDPGFLHPGAPSYIGSVLNQYASGTPGGFILRAFALPAPALAGIGVALVEIIVGLLVGVGLVTRRAALVGLALNLLLFLTASWKTYPYFLGSDIVFVFAWMPIVLAGTAGQPAFEHVLERRVEEQASISRRRIASSPGRAVPSDGPDLTRRRLITQAIGGIGVLTALTAGLASVFKGSYHGGNIDTATLTGQGGSSRSRGRTTSAGHSQHSSRSAHEHASPVPRTNSPASSGASPPQGAVRLAAANRLPPSTAALYHDPSDGQADIIVRQADGSLDAFSAICTHAGCEVDYQAGVIACPCHGSVFNPRTGVPEQGPATVPLPRRQVVEYGGQIYALRS